MANVNLPPDDKSARSMFERIYGMRLPAEGVTVTRSSIEEVALNLQFPKWKFANPDGSRDPSRAVNPLVTRPSSVRLRSLRVWFDDPMSAYKYACRLRANGVQIPPCKHERGAVRTVASERLRELAMRDAPELAERYANNPTEFEPWCADLLKGFGWDAHRTPPSNDGGVDVIARRRGILMIVECKCYGQQHTVGRPVIQKLVGANDTWHADRMLVMTTTQFTAPAIEYAARAGVELVDGTRLAELSRRVTSDTSAIDRSAAADVTLTPAMMRSWMPPDLKECYPIRG